MRLEGDVAARSGITRRSLALGMVWLPVATLMLYASPVQAQTDGPEVGAVVRVANTDGQRLNVRAGPATDQPIVARALSGEALTVTGTARTVGVTRWLPVRTGAGVSGWVSAEFVVLVSGPSVASGPGPSVGSGSASVSSTTEAAGDRVPMSERSREKGRPVDVEAKLKFPEVTGRDQEITVWVMRDGNPVVGAVVTVESSDGDDDEPFRELDPTDDEGRTRRRFDVRHEKGTVELQVEAVAPDGGEGRTSASYFKR